MVRVGRRHRSVAYRLLAYVTGALQSMHSDGAKGVGPSVLQRVTVNSCVWGRWL